MPIGMGRESKATRKQRQTWSRGYVVACAAIATGCAGKVVQPVAAPVTPPAAASAAAVVDLSEVPPPANLVALLRWRNAQATFDTIYQWTGIRLSPSDLAGEAYDKALAETLAYDAPVDAAVAIDDKANQDLPHVAVAFGVRSLEGARRAAQGVGTVTDGRPGEYRIRMKPNKRHAERAFCLLSAAVGAAPARLVCGQHERDVDALAPYMTRTLPKADLGQADLHIELHPPALVNAYGPSIDSGLHFAAVYGPRRMQIGEPTFDRAIERAAAGLTGELGLAIRDADKVSLDVSLAPDHAAIDAQLRLRGTESWTAGTLASEAGRAGPAPELFWRLPLSATGASYQFTPEASRFVEIRRTLVELLDGWLLHQGLGTADRTPLVGPVGELFAHDMPWVSASGTFADAGKPAAAAKPTAAAADQVSKEAWERRWSVIGFASNVPLADLAKRLVAGFNRPKVQAALKKSLFDLANAPGDQPGSSPAFKGAMPLTIKALAAPKGLPTGSLEFEVTLVRPNAKSSAKVDKPDVAKVRVMLISRPNESWVGFSSERDQLAAILRNVLDDAKDAPTLAKRTDLEPLRNGRFVSASFATPLGVLNAWQSPLLAMLGVADLDKKLAEVERSLDTAPHKGQSAMRFTTAIDASGPPNVNAHLDVPKAVIEDVIIAAASSLMQGLGRP